MKLTWLADVLRGAGCKVVEHDGWRTRGKELSTVAGIVWHHTASGPQSSDAAVAALLIGGRPDLPGPLCQLGLARDGAYHLIAAGRANHNGYGEWGNQSIGIEAYNDGVGEPWPQVQVDAYVKGTAAILAHLGLNTSRVKGHKETDPRRKIDPAGLDMNRMRQRIAYAMTYKPPTEEDDMPTADEVAKALVPLLRPMVREEVGRSIGWTRAVAESPQVADNDPQSKRLADRAAHLNPERK